MLLIGYAAVNAGANLVYYLFAFLIAMYLTHGLVSPRNLHRLRVRRLLPRRVVAGQPSEIRIEIENGRRLGGAYALVVEDVAVPRVAVGFAACEHVAARARATVGYPTRHAVFGRRGLVTFRELVVRSRFPFGFIERSFHFKMPAELVVLPPVYKIAEDPLSGLGELGDAPAPQRGTGTDLYGLREYAEGEPARRIHWRTSARAGQLMVAEFEREEFQQIILYLPTSVPAPSAAASELFEHAVIVTASLAAYFIEKGFEVGLVTDAGRIMPQSGRSHLERILRALALVQLTPGTNSTSREIPHHVLAVAHGGPVEVRRARTLTVEHASNWQVVQHELRRVGVQ